MEKFYKMNEKIVSDSFSPALDLVFGSSIIVRRGKVSLINKHISERDRENSNDFSTLGRTQL